MFFELTLELHRDACRTSPLQIDGENSSNGSRNFDIIFIMGAN